MKRKNNKGFTITELVIVIAVIAILASVLIPTFSNVVKKANQSAYLQESTSAMKNYLANLAEDGKAYSDGLMFIYDNNRSDDDVNALGVIKVGEKTDNRFYYAYINNSLHKVEVVGRLGEVCKGDDALGDYFQAKSTDNGPYYKTADFLVYKVNVNGTLWYGVASVSGVKGYGSASSVETDAVRVCTGLAVPVESAAAVANDTAGAKLVVKSATLEAGATYQALGLQQGETGTIAGSWEMADAKVN